MSSYVVAVVIELNMCSAYTLTPFCLLSQPTHTYHYLQNPPCPHSPTLTHTQVIHPCLQNNVHANKHLTKGGPQTPRVLSHPLL